MIYTGNDIQKVLDATFSASAKFCRYEYFYNKLWKKVKGFEDKDEADVRAAFLAAWIYNETEIMCAPCGLCWARLTYDKEWFDNYINDYEDLFKDFANWCMLQR